jgi:hypothetical protein
MILKIIKKLINNMEIYLKFQNKILKKKIKLDKIGKNQCFENKVLKL